MSIRLANRTDIPAIQGLLHEILLVHHQARPDVFKPVGSKYSNEDLEAIVANPNSPIFLYQKDEAVLGHLFLQVKEQAETATTYACKMLYIDDLCVSDKARGQKIGQKLYDFALHYANDIDADHLTLNVWNANEGALRFYQRQGLKPRETKLEIRLKK